MTNELQSMSDWLYSNLLGVQGEWPEHNFSSGFDVYQSRCKRCDLTISISEEDDDHGICRPTLPLLSAPEQYWRVIEALAAKGYAFSFRPDKMVGNGFMLRLVNSQQGCTDRWGATIGEAVVRSAFAALGGE